MSDPTPEDQKERTSGSEGIHPRPSTPLPESSQRKPLSDLSRRLMTAAILVPLVTYLIVIGGYPYLIAVLAFGLLAQMEFYRLIEGKGARPLVLTGLAFGAAVIAVAWIGSGYLATLLMTASLLVLMVAQLRKARIQEALASISGTFFGVFYVAWLLSHAVLLRFFYHSAGDRYSPASLSELGINPDSGIFLMLFCVVVVVACDAGAYFAGRAWGRHKLAPEVSPNKSIEGALGGIVIGTLSGGLVKFVFDLFWPSLSVFLPWQVAMGLAFVLCPVGIVGDLVESLLKRDADIKDTGALLPGMGGVLDRIDAVLLALPVMFYLLLGYVGLQVS